MKSHEFLKQLDEQRIVATIHQAERKSSGEIRVMVSEKLCPDPLGAARHSFQKLGMDRTHERNGVLIYFVPAARKFAVVGDVGVHAKCGDNFWQEVAAGMETDLKAGRFTDAIVGAVTRVGDLLAQHFPRRPDDQNELPDAVVRD